MAFSTSAMAAALPDTRADPYAALPHALALHVFGDLTVEERLRCREVCRGWCATLADHTLWLRLDLTRADGAACSVALLRAATARAGGQLRALRLTYRAHERGLHQALCKVAAANSATLQELRLYADFLPFFLPVLILEALLHAAPQLEVLEADAACADVDETHLLLCNKPPFGPLRVRRFTLWANHDAALLALAADVAAHVWLTGLCLLDANLDDPTALDAVVDAALARRLSLVQLRACLLSPASVRALVRLLGGNTLTELCIINKDSQLLDEPAAALLGDALRANTSLTSLTLIRSGLWRHNPAAAVVLCATMAGHPRLRVIDLSCNPLHGNVADASTALGALVAANAPALQQLNVSYCELGDAGMGPLVEALRHNTHLHVLSCVRNEMSEAFAHDCLLPAVRANNSLRKLTVDDGIVIAPESARKAAALVAARAQQPRA
jgi:hypothetical protein